MGIEPTLFAWEAKVLPLNYTRFSISLIYLAFTALRLIWREFYALFIVALILQITTLRLSTLEGLA